jgi:hypothetical protein
MRGSETDRIFPLNSIPKLCLPDEVRCGCETWSLTLGEIHRLYVFDNRVLRRIFGPNRNEVIGGWRKLHDMKFH